MYGALMKLLMTSSVVLGAMVLMFSGANHSAAEAPTLDDLTFSTLPGDLLGVGLRLSEPLPEPTSISGIERWKLSQFGQNL